MINDFYASYYNSKLSKSRLEYLNQKHPWVFNKNLIEPEFLKKTDEKSNINEQLNSKIWMIIDEDKIVKGPFSYINIKENFLQKIILIKPVNKDFYMSSEFFFENFISFWNEKENNFINKNLDISINFSDSYSNNDSKSLFNDNNESNNSSSNIDEEIYDKSLSNNPKFDIENNQEFLNWDYKFEKIEDSENYMELYNKYNIKNNCKCDICNNNLEKNKNNSKNKCKEYESNKRNQNINNYFNDMSKNVSNIFVDNNYNKKVQESNIQYNNNNKDFKKKNLKKLKTELPKNKKTDPYMDQNIMYNQIWNPFNQYYYNNNNNYQNSIKKNKLNDDNSSFNSLNEKSINSKNHNIDDSEDEIMNHLNNLSIKTKKKRSKVSSKVNSINNNLNININNNLNNNFNIYYSNQQINNPYMVNYNQYFINSYNYQMMNNIAFNSMNNFNVKKPEKTKKIPGYKFNTMQNLN